MRKLTEWKTILSGTVVACVFAAGTVHADVPRLIHFQGKLIATGGANMVGPVTLRVRLYNDSSNAAPVLLDETHANVPLTQGLFSIRIGSQIGDVPDSALDAPEIFLGVSVDGAAELTPRTRIGTAPFGVKAKSAEQLVKPGTFDAAVTVDGGGNVTVGSTSPVQQLEINGPVSAGGGTGTAGQVLTSQGASAAPAWTSNPAGSTFTNSQVFSGNAPTAWQTLDLSGVIGVRQAMVMIRISNTSGNSTMAAFREPGSGEVDAAGTYTDYSGFLSAARLSPNRICDTIVKTDTSGRIEWRGNDASATVNVSVQAYW